MRGESLLIVSDWVATPAIQVIKSKVTKCVRVEIYEKVYSRLIYAYSSLQFTCYVGRFNYSYAVNIATRKANIFFIQLKHVG